MNIRWSYDHLISTMGFPNVVIWYLYIESAPWAPFQNIYHLPRCRDSHCNDKMFARPSYLYNGNSDTGSRGIPIITIWDHFIFIMGIPITGNMTSLYWYGPSHCFLQTTNYNNSKSLYWLQWMLVVLWMFSYFMFEVYLSSLLIFTNNRGPSQQKLSVLPVKRFTL